MVSCTAAAAMRLHAAMPMLLYTDSGEHDAVGHFELLQPACYPAGLVAATGSCRDWTGLSGGMAPHNASVPPASAGVLMDPAPGAAPELFRSTTCEPPPAELLWRTHSEFERWLPSGISYCDWLTEMFTLPAHSVRKLILHWGPPVPESTRQGSAAQWRELCMVTALATARLREKCDATSPMPNLFPGSWPDIVANLDGAVASQWHGSTAACTDWLLDIASSDTETLRHLLYAHSLPLLHTHVDSPEGWEELCVAIAFSKRLLAEIGDIASSPLPSQPLMDGSAVVHFQGGMHVNEKDPLAEILQACGASEFYGQIFEAGATVGNIAKRDANIFRLMFPQVSHEQTDAILAMARSKVGPMSQPNVSTNGGAPATPAAATDQLVGLGIPRRLALNALRQFPADMAKAAEVALAAMDQYNTIGVSPDDRSGKCSTLHQPAQQYGAHPISHPRQQPVAAPAEQCAPPRNQSTAAQQHPPVLVQDQFRTAPWPPQEVARTSAAHQHTTTGFVSRSSCVLGRQSQHPGFQTHCAPTEASAQPDAFPQPVAPRVWPGQAGQQFVHASGPGPHPVQMQQTGAFPQPVVPQPDAFPQPVVQPGAGAFPQPATYSTAQHCQQRAGADLPPPCMPLDRQEQPRHPQGAAICVPPHQGVPLLQQSRPQPRRLEQMQPRGGSPVSSGSEWGDNTGEMDWGDLAAQADAEQEALVQYLVTRWTTDEEIDVTDWQAVALEWLRGRYPAECAAATSPDISARDWHSTWADAAAALLRAMYAADREGRCGRSVSDFMGATLKVGDIHEAAALVLHAAESRVASGGACPGLCAAMQSHTTTLSDSLREFVRCGRALGRTAAVGQPDGTGQHQGWAVLRCCSPAARRQTHIHIRS